jgi:hypothetical protein
MILEIKHEDEWTKNTISPCNLHAHKMPEAIMIGNV